MISNTFRQTQDGRQVYVSGIVVIEGTAHRVQNGFIFCNAQLNHIAWNTTQKKSNCLICFPAKRGEQLKLF